MAKTRAADAAEQKVKKNKDIEEMQVDKKAAKRKQREEEAAAAVDDAPAKPKKSKKQAADADDDGTAAPAKKSKRAAKESESEEDGKPPASPTAAAPITASTPASELGLDRFPLSEQVKSMLRSQGIESLFPIQAMTLQPGLDGLDVVGRARTGCGKTLAFTLPLVERIIAEQKKGATAGRAPGRLPIAIVLAPTRELAKQVRAQFRPLAHDGNGWPRPLM